MQEVKKVQEVFEGNIFTFMCEQPDGTTNILKAKATTWSKALDHFNFLSLSVIDILLIHLRIQFLL